MKKYCAAWLAVLSILVTGCSSDAAIIGGEDGPESVIGTNSEMITFTDDLGREVTVENPQRVAALLGSFADMWMLAGGTVCAAPDDAWEDFQLDLPGDAINLGQNNEMSLEKLFASEPDLILASVNKRIDMEWTDTLEKSGIPTAYFDVADFEDYLRVLKICSEITGREDLYEMYGLSVQEKIRSVLEKSEKRVAENGAPKVLFLRASASYIRVKNSEGSVLGEMLRSLGCRNIADSNDSLLENISMEYILQEDPEFIFFVQSGDDKEGMEAHVQQFIQENPAWQELTAVKEDRVFYMDKHLFNLKPNDRWGEAYEELEAILAEGQK